MRGPLGSSGGSASLCMWELAFIPSSHPSSSLFHLPISVFQRVLVYVLCVPHVSGVGFE